jgi:hypothetical protein
MWIKSCTTITFSKERFKLGKKIYFTSRIVDVDNKTPVNKKIY